MNNKNEKQRLLVEYLISSPDTFTLCKSIIKSDYFDPELRKTVSFVHEYYDRYRALPSVEQIYAETNIKLTKHEITKDQIMYCSTEIEQFCKVKAIQHAILAAPSIMADEGSLVKSFQDACSISLNRDMGIDYFLAPMERLERMMQEPPRISTGWKPVDDLLGGGLARTEMILFSAGSGVGKSITLANLTLNLIDQRLNVLYLSLELSEDMICQRFDMMHTGISTVVWRHNVDKIAATITTLSPHKGKLTVKRMSSGTTANQIRSYLKEFELIHGYLPDALVVDYIDKMGANEHVSIDNIAGKDEKAAEQLSDIGADYNMIVATASQEGRQSINAPELNQSIIAGGMGKIRTADWYITIIMSPTMKAAGEIGFMFLKTRSSDGVGKTVYLRWEHQTLRVLNPTDDNLAEDDGIAARLSQLKSPQKGKKSLADLLDM